MVAPAEAQERFRVADNVAFRKSANGVILGTLARGTEVTPRRTDGSWVEIRLEGWMFGRSLSRTSRDGFDVNVVPRRENIRAEPNGRVLGQASTGALFNRVEERGGWTHLRRDVWISRSSLQPLSAPVTAQRPPSRDTTRRSAAAPDTTRRPAAGVGAGISAPAAPGDNIEAATGTRLLTTPDGESIGTLQQGTPVRVLSRSGEWVRVQVEAWVKEADTRPASDSGALAGVTAAEVRAAPARYIGKVVDWRLQFLAVQKADELRPEIPQGRFYLLTRGPLPESGFVYVIIPQDQADHFRALAPLEEILVRGTIKAATTRYLPNPVLELIAVGN